MAKDINLGEMIGSQTRANVSDQLYQRIRSLILSGDLKEGYVFPNETDFCEQLQVGRTTLREAYKALELSGFVTRTKRGTFVNSKSTIMSATPLKTIFETASLEDFSQFRLMLETKSAYLAAQHAELHDVEILDDNLNQSILARKENDIQQLMYLDTVFHTYIASLSQNSLIISLVSVIATAWENNIHHNFDSAVHNDQSIFDSMVIQHKAILEAIRNRNCNLAQKVMEEHLLTVSKQ